MEQVVYIDVLFGINFVANFLILWATDQLLRLHTKGRWLALGALGGALYAVLIFFPRLSFAYSAAAKMLFSLGLVALTYRIRGSRLFFKTLAVFYTVSVFLGGALVAFFYVSGIGSKTGAVVRNGSLYFEMPWRPVMLGFLAGYPAVWIVCRLLRRKKEEHLYPIRLTQGQKTVNLMGILDTGNHLKEPFSGNAVLVAEYERVRDILPSEFCLCFEKKRSEGREETSDWEEVFSAASGLRLRAIPFHSVGRENGMLVGFCPDRVSVEENEREIALSKVVVGLYAGQLSKDNRYGALLSPEMMK